MSQQEPTEPYVYQPDPSNSLEDEAWALAGPGAELYRDQRFTKAHAEQQLRALKLRLELEEISSVGRRCGKCGGQMAHYRLWGYRCLGCGR